MKRIFSITVLIALLLGCKSTNQTDDPENLKGVLFSFFDALKAKDYQKLKEVTTADFILYEDGKIYNNDSLVKALNKFPKFTAEYKFDNFKIDVGSDIASMFYLNHGDFVFNDTTHVSFNWLESADFKKVDDKWKLEFLHSTVRK